MWSTPCDQHAHSILGIPPKSENYDFCLKRDSVIKEEIMGNPNLSKLYRPTFK